MTPEADTRKAVYLIFKFNNVSETGEIKSNRRYIGFIATVDLVNKFERFKLFLCGFVCFIN